MKNHYRKLLMTGTFAVLLMLVSCENFVEIAPPKTESVSATIFTDDVTANGAVRGIYHEMSRVGFATGQSISMTVATGASSDEFRSLSTSEDEFFNNGLTASSSSILSAYWTPAYKSIYYSNAVIEGLSSTSGVNASLKRQLEGEAKFLRAFNYFYLVQLFGDVPLILSTDYRLNAASARTPKAEVLTQIVRDLTEAQALLPTDYKFTNSERVRATSWAATALLARAYLYQGDWLNAEMQSTLVINNTALFRILNDLNTVFLKNSNETIWQLFPVSAGVNTFEAQVFVPASATTLPTYVAMTDKLVAAFEAGDKRKTNWTGNQTVAGNVIYYPLKYKVFRTGQPLTEYSMVLRFAELYLIRAEAFVRQNKLNEAMTDLNVIRTRAGLANIQTKIPVPNADDLLSAVEQERRVELFAEWSHRWFDLKRTGRATAVLGSVKPGWNSTKELYPIPQSELNANPNLNPQNQGY